MRLLTIIGFFMVLIGGLAIGFFWDAGVSSSRLGERSRWNNIQCSGMDKSSLWMGSRISGTLASEEPIAIMFYGEGVGDRILILDGEPSCRVFLRVYFYSSANCTWNQTVFPPATIKSIMLDYNTSYALDFHEVNGSHVWIFNVHTSTKMDYLEEELFIQRGQWLEDVYNARIHIISFSVAGIIFAVKVRKMER